MPNDLMYLGRIQRRFYKARSLLMMMGVSSLLGAATLYTYVSLGSGSPSPSSSFLVTFAQTAIIALVALSALAVAWKGAFVGALSVLGVLLVAGSLLFPVQEYIPSTYGELDTHDPDDMYSPDGEFKVKHLVWRFEPAHALTPASKTVMFCLGFGLVGLSMLMVYRPSMLYVRNRPVDEPPYPVWDSKNGFATTSFRYREMVPLRNLLNAKERYMLSRYRYVQVRIGEKLYLVTSGSLVPDGSEVVRDTKNGLFLGVH